ncbi:hypothetical protein AHAS_Ahas05G0146200 [Arachis hypogaea]
MIDYEQFTQWGYAPGPQNDQENYMGYCPPPQNDSCHYPYGVWEYQQGMRECEQSSEMGYLPEPQNDTYCYDNYTNCD